MKAQVKRIWRVLPGPVRAPVEIVIKTVNLYIDDSCTTYAAAIAYYAIFSIVPLGLITLSIFGLIVDREQLADWVFEQLPLEETESVRSNVDAIIGQAQDLSPASLGFGLVFLLWSSTGIFGAVRKGLNAAAHTKMNRPYWRSKLVDLALVPLVGVLILVSVTVTAMARLVVQRVDELGPVPVDETFALQAAAIVVPAVATFVMFILLYRYTPAAKPHWRDALAGAFFATLLFEITKNVMAAIIAESSFSQDTAIYAGFGTALAFLLWMFVSASILLLGAEFGRALRLRRDLALGVPDEDEVISPEFLGATSAKPGTQAP